MSEVSVISNQYNKMVIKSDLVNNSVITFKKRSLLAEKHAHTHYPNINVTKEEIAEARRVLIAFLKSVRAILNGEEIQSDYVPSLIATDYKTNLSSNVYLEEDISDLLYKLENDQDLNGESISILDSLLALLDKERNALFRKLRRARG